MTPAEQGQERVAAKTANGEPANGERWTIKGCSVCGFESLVREAPQGSALDHAVHEKGNPGEFEIEVVPAADNRALVEAIEAHRASRHGDSPILRRVDPWDKKLSTPPSTNRGRGHGVDRESAGESARARRSRRKGRRG